MDNALYECIYFFMCACVPCNYFKILSKIKYFTNKTLYTVRQRAGMILQLLIFSLGNRSSDSYDRTKSVRPKLAIKTTTF